MRRGWWRTLDIDPTTDRAVIRRAYAARLRAMDVDADPDGFARLRDARDAALADAAVADVATHPLPDPEADPPPPPPEPAIDPREQAHRAAIEAHFHALEALLFPDDELPPTPAQLTAIAHHGRALLDDYRLEQVDFAAGAERWFAERLAASIPRCDPLLEPAAATFGWIDRRGDYALSADAHRVVERIGAMRFAALVADPDHRLHRAWRELNREDPAPKPWWSPKGLRRELLSTIRRSYPEVEGWLVPARVADADYGQSGSGGFPIWLVIIVIVTVLRITIGSGTPSAPPPTPVPLPAMERNLAPVPDPDAVARMLTGRDMAHVTRSNPGLGSDIRNTVASLEGTTDPHLAATTLDALQRKRTMAGLATASDALLRDIARFELAGMNRYIRSDPIRCRDYIFPVGNARIAPGQEERQEALLHRVVLESGDREPSSVHRYRVPGSIMTTIARTTGLPDTRIDNGLSGKGEHADVCRVQIALRQAALAAGGDGTKLLRDMQS